MPVPCLGGAKRSESKGPVRLGATLDGGPLPSAGGIAEAGGPARWDSEMSAAILFPESLCDLAGSVQGFALLVVIVAVGARSGGLQCVSIRMGADRGNLRWM